MQGNQATIKLHLAKSMSTVSHYLSIISNTVSQSQLTVVHTVLLLINLPNKCLLWNNLKYLYSKSSENLSKIEVTINTRWMAARISSDYALNRREIYI